MIARKQTGPLLCIANIHVFSNPKFPDVKLWQAVAMVKQVCKIYMMENKSL